MGSSSALGPVMWLRRNSSLFAAALILLLIPFLLLACKQQAVLSPQQSAKPALGQGTAAPPPAPTQWTQLSLFDGKINTLLVEDSSGVRWVYVGTDGGVFKSEDQGKTWISCNDGLTNRLVRALAADPDDPNTLYAGTWNGKVHLSTDGGTSWQERSTGLPPYETRALAVHTYDTRRLYAGTPNGVFTTTNQGEQWLPAGEFAGTLQCMVVDPERPNTLYIGTATHGIYKSINGGATWFRLNTGFSSISALVMLSRAPTTIYAISDGKVYRTGNEGVLWTYVDSYRDPAVARCLAVNPKNAREVYVGLQDGLYRSEDERQSWSRSDTGLAPADVAIVAVDPIETQTVYACSANRLFASMDAGATWEQCSAILTGTAASILALKADPKSGSVFYASTAGGGLYKTTNKGDDWSHVGESLPLAWITAIEVEPINTQTVYLGIREGFVFRSTDGGTTWAPAGAVTESVITALAVDSEQPQRLYAGTSDRGLFRSDDSGAHWYHKGSDIGSSIQRVVIDPRGPQTKVYVLTEKGVFRSQDSGENWSPYLSPVADIVSSIKGGFEPLVVTRPDATFVTGQGMSEAVTVVQSSRVAPGADLKALSVSPALPHVLYVLAGQQGLFRSVDLGASWTALGSGLEARELRVLALSPDDPDLILVGTDQGIYRYQPQGQ